MATPQLIEGTFASTTGVSEDRPLEGHFNLSLAGLAASSVNIERSFDAGATWKLVKSYTADIEDTGIEPETGVYYRLNCTSNTADTIIFRLSQRRINNAAP